MKNLIYILPFIVLYSCAPSAEEVAEELIKKAKEENQKQDSIMEVDLKKAQEISDEMMNDLILDLENSDSIELEEFDPENDI